MTDFELEERIKEKFDSIMDKLFRLANEYEKKNFSLERIFFLEIMVLARFSEIQISVTENEKHKWIRLLYKLGMFNRNNQEQSVDLKKSLCFYGRNG